MSYPTPTGYVYQVLTPDQVQLLKRIDLVTEQPIVSQFLDRALQITGGSVTSVGLFLPSSLFDIINSPITSSGDLEAAFKSFNSNLVFASPDGSSGVPSMRSLVVGDIPSLPANQIPQATTSTDGYLSSVDWNTFNDKVNKSGDTMTGLLTLSGNAVNPLNPVTLQQFNLGLVGLTPKGSVEAASDANINLASPASALIDSHTLNNGDRFLAQTQTNPIENGIYIFNGVGVAATRDGLLTGDDAFGSYVSVVNGATYAGQFRICISDPAIVDTDDLIWDFQASGALTGDGITIEEAVPGLLNIVPLSITNALVNASAAIDGTKIDPDFGSQNVITTGTGSFESVQITGTAGSGFVEYNRQNANPSAPADGFKLFSSNSDGLSFIGAAGNSAEFRPNLLTGNHVYNLPNANGILALIPGSGFVTSNGTSLSNQPTIDLGLDVSGVLDVSMGGTGSTSYTAGSVIFANASQLTEDNANFFYDDGNNRLGLGTTSPSFRLQLGGSGGSAYLQRDPLGAYISGSANSPTKLVVENTFGSSVASEIAISSRPSGAMGAFEDLGWLSFFGRDDAGNQRRGAYIRGITSGAWTSSSLPTHMDFFTVPSGYASEIQRARLFSSGEMYFGSTGLVGNTGTLQIGALTSAKIGLYMQMQSGQTADAMRIVNNSGIPFFTIDADGDIAGKSLRLRATDSTGVIQIDAQTTGAFTAPPSGFKFSSDSLGRPTFVNTAGNSVVFNFNNTTTRTYDFINDSYIVANVPAVVGPVKSTGSDLITGNIDMASEVTGVLAMTNGGTGVSSISSGIVISNGSVLSSIYRSVIKNVGITTNTTVTYANISDLTSGSLPVGKYKIKAYIYYQSAATTTGIGLRLVNGTATVSNIKMQWTIPLTATTAANIAQIATTTNSVATSTPAANTTYLAIGQGIVDISSQGTIIPQLRSEIAGSAVSVQVGSVLEIEEM